MATAEKTASKPLAGAQGKGEFKRGRRDETRSERMTLNAINERPSGAQRGREVHDTSGTAVACCGRGNLHPFSLLSPERKQRTNQSNESGQNYNDFTQTRTRIFFSGNNERQTINSPIAKSR